MPQQPDRDQRRDGITVVDSGYLRPRFDALYLVESDGEVALIDTATAHAVERVGQALHAIGRRFGDVTRILLTHVHLDHAGGAGVLMQHCPQARLAVHPRGVRHMTDPARLWAGTVGVYGQRLAERLYGGVTPVEAARIDEATDGATFTVGRRALHVLDAPGHARHHVVFHDPAAGTVFTGDAAGIAYPELDAPAGALLLPSSTPVQFDPAAMVGTLHRIAALRPATLCLTHYGRVPVDEATLRHTAALAAQYARLGLDVEAALPDEARDPRRGHAPDAGRTQRRAADLRDAMADLMVQAVQQHGCTLDDAAIRALLDADVRLNADGIACWLDERRAKDHHPGA